MSENATQADIDAANELLRRRRLKAKVSAVAPPSRAVSHLFSILEAERREELTAEEARARFEAEVAPLAVELRACAVCGREEAPTGDEICPRVECGEVYRRRKLGRREILSAAGVPLDCRDFALDVLGAWPGVLAFRDGKATKAGSAETLEPCWLTIIGRNGRGKSTLAAEILWRWFAASGCATWPLAWVSAVDLCDEDRELGLGRQRPAMHAAKAAAIAVVDDAGWDPAQLHRLGAVALARGRRPTIWTTHLPIGGRGGILERAPALGSRLLGGRVIRLDGRDLRTRGDARCEGP